MTKTKVAYIIIALIVIVLIGLYAYNNSKKGKEESKQESNQQMENTSKTNNEGNKELCTRNFDTDKLKNDKVDIKNKVVTLSVSGYGDIKIELYDRDAPKTVENFLRLVNAGFYDCLTFHRVAKGFVIQGGDPEGNGTGGESAFGGEFADELNANSASFKAGYVKGVVAMANRGPNTNTSQFFITLEDLNASLPKNYTIFGKVIAGQEVVDKIGSVEIEPGPFGAGDGQPVSPVTITKAVISDK